MTYQELVAKYTREYFEDNTTGYSLYRDFPVHWKTFEVIMDRKPVSALELGAAYGFIVKRLNDAGVPSWGLEISPHCWHRRVTNNLKIGDATEKLPFEDGQFDLCYSAAFMEHIPGERLPNLVKEMARVSKRGLHGITWSITPGDIDVTHRLADAMHPKEWWEQKFKELAPNYPVEIMDKEDMEKPPVNLPKPDGSIKLNVGSFVNMFHYGWVNMDIVDVSNEAKAYGYVFHHYDVRNGFLYGGGSVNLVYASHFLEHLNPAEGHTFLKECFRVLKKEGVIRIIVPNTKLLVKKYLDGKMSEFDDLNPVVAKSQTQAEKLRALLMDNHLSLYDAKSLDHAFRGVGFTDVTEMEFGVSRNPQMQKETWDALPTISLYVEAVK